MFQLLEAVRSALRLVQCMSQCRRISDGSPLLQRPEGKIIVRFVATRRLESLCDSTTATEHMLPHHDTRCLCVQSWRVLVMPECLWYPVHSMEHRCSPFLIELCGGSAEIER